MPDHHHLLEAALIALALLVVAPLHAQEEPEDPEAVPTDEAAPADPVLEEEDEGEGEDEEDYIDLGDPIEIDVTAIRPFNPGRATSKITREEIKLRMPRSAPDALRYEPGVYVQQTAHSQGSAFIRGRTGQQTVLLFDEIRLNNSLFRQGPNQYFFTIDSATIDHIDVLRGSASTRYGTDAIAGVINASPIHPSFDKEEKGFALHPGGLIKYGSADGEIGGRLQLDMHHDRDFGLIGGVGYRRVGLLESGGQVLNIRDGGLPEVPRFAPDERTQLGTGFREFTADARGVIPLGKRGQLVLGYYDYRQFDAPRTDSCAPPEAPFNECLKYDEQNRLLVFGRLLGELGEGAKDARLTLSWQRQHERRNHERPLSFVINGGRDDVDTFGLAAHAETAFWDPAESVSTKLRYGADVYHDRVQSTAWLIFTDIEVTRLRSRGQYIEGSSYSWGGVFAESETLLWDTVSLKAGGRASVIAAEAPADPESGTNAVDKQWSSVVGNISAEWWATDWLTLILSADQGFRAPNLDDMTSRQRTGPGFQFENAFLEPERALTTEVGLQVVTEDVEFDGWLFYSTLDEAIARAGRDASQCPPNTSACNNSRSQFQLVNLPGTSLIYGAEASLRVGLPMDLSARTTISYAFGEGPNPEERPSDPSLSFEETVPLSRIPPLNGTFELLWRGERGLYAGTGLRWATTQDRLALSDQSDARIPLGGTPGYVVADLRGGWRFSKRGLLSAVFENITDEAYRTHGSSVNGPGRGLVVSLEMGF